MDYNSTIKFKDFEYEYGMFTKLTWNGEVVYDEETALADDLRKIDELYADRLVYEMKVTVVDFHHVQLDITGETPEHAQLNSEAEKQFKEIVKYVEDKNMSYSLFGNIIQVNLGEKFGMSYTDDYFTPALDFILGSDGDISVTPYINSHTKPLTQVMSDWGEEPVYNEEILEQLNCYNYAVAEAKKFIEKFNLVSLDTDVQESE